MKISRLFHYYYLPDNLKQHIYWVAAVGSYIIDHWTGPEINKDTIIPALLFHDIGNLMKYDFSNKSNLLDPTLNKTYWRNIQKRLGQRYGAKDSEVTKNMLQEMGINTEIIDIVDGLDASELQKIYELDLELQICEYSDMRITPWGITSLEKRLKDIQERYHNHNNTWAKKKLFENNVIFGKKIEQRLQKYTSIDITKIPQSKINSYLVELPQYKIDISPWKSFIFQIRHFVKPLSR